MNSVHLHLIITHLPIFGSILGGIVLATGLWTRSNQTKIAAYFLFIISGLGAVIAFLSGEGAEETVENIPGIVNNIIAVHEDFASITLTSFILLGAISFFGLFLTFKNSKLTRAMAFSVLLLSMVSFGLSARTGYLGGKIRHSEINNAPASVENQQLENEADDED